jgi:phosphatidylserine decarboxylase
MGLTALVDESFVGGTVYQGFLSPWCYHQWHSPVSGIVEKAYVIEGTLFLQNPNYDQSSSSSNFPDSLTFLSCVSTRYVYIINT